LMAIGIYLNNHVGTSHRCGGSELGTVAGYMQLAADFGSPSAAFLSLGGAGRGIQCVASSTSMRSRRLLS
jgi:hypothetical protein